MMAQLMRNSVRCGFMGSAYHSEMEWLTECADDMAGTGYAAAYRAFYRRGIITRGVVSRQIQVINRRARFWPLQIGRTSKGGALLGDHLMPQGLRPCGESRCQLCNDFCRKSLMREFLMRSFGTDRHGQQARLTT